jgi:hypothetical protein
MRIQQGEQDDWIVKEDGGRELGHYPSRPEAEAVGRKLARKKKAELVIQDKSGKIEQRSHPYRGWFGRVLFGR